MWWRSSHAAARIEGDTRTKLLLNDRLRRRWNRRRCAPCPRKWGEKMRKSPQLKTATDRRPRSTASKNVRSSFRPALEDCREAPRDRGRGAGVGLTSCCEEGWREAVGTGDVSTTSASSCASSAASGMSMGGGGGRSRSRTGAMVAAEDVEVRAAGCALAAPVLSVLARRVISCMSAPMPPPDVGGARASQGEGAGGGGMALMALAGDAMGVAAPPCCMVERRLRCCLAWSSCAASEPRGGLGMSSSSSSSSSTASLFAATGVAGCIVGAGGGAGTAAALGGAGVASALEKRLAWSSPGVGAGAGGGGTPAEGGGGGTAVVVPLLLLVGAGGGGGGGGTDKETLASGINSGTSVSESLRGWACDGSGWGR